MGYPLQYHEEEFQPFEWTWTVRHHEHLLRPDAACINSVLGVIGRCQALYPEDEFRLYYATIESTHLHMVCATRDPVVAANVKRHLATNIAKEIQALRNLDRGGIWARRCRSIPILGTLDDRLKYLLAHGYKSQIVARITQWPGLDMLKAVLKGATLTGTWYNRVAYGAELWSWKQHKRVLKGKLKGRERRSALKAYFAQRPRLRDFAIEYPVRLTTPPTMAGLDEAAQRSAWQRLVDEAEVKYAPELKKSGAKRPVLGLERVLKTSPRKKPLVPKKRTPAPWVHVKESAEYGAWLKRYWTFVGTFRGYMARLAQSTVELIELPWNGWAPPALAQLRASAPWVELAPLA